MNSWPLMLSALSFWLHQREMEPQWARGTTKVTACPIQRRRVVDYMPHPLGPWHTLTPGLSLSTTLPTLQSTMMTTWCEGHLRVRLTIRENLFEGFIQWWASNLWDYRKDLVSSVSSVILTDNKDIFSRNYFVFMLTVKWREI